MKFNTSLRVALLASILSVASSAQAASWQSFEKFNNGLGQFTVENNGESLTVTNENGRMRIRQSSRNAVSYKTRIVLTGSQLEQAKGIRWTLATQGCGNNDYFGLIASIDMHEGITPNHDRRRGELSLGLGTYNGQRRWIIGLESEQRPQKYKSEIWFDDMINSARRVTMRVTDRLVSARIGQSPELLYVVPPRRIGKALPDRKMEIVPVINRDENSNCSIWIDNVDLLM